YLPLDPYYPRERLAYMLADGAPAALLVQDRFRDRLPELGAVPGLSLEDELAGVAAEPGDPPPAAPAFPDQAAYVLYTSGSTGRPKGVVVSHGGLAGMHLAWKPVWPAAPGPLVQLQAASFSFDVFGEEVLRALGSGGSLLLCPQELLGDPERLVGLMRREGVTIADLVPAVARGVARHLETTGERLDSLSLLVIGADVFQVEERERFVPLCGPGTRLVGAYGVTEASVDSTWFERTAVPLPAGTPVPLGRPFEGTRVHLVDPGFRPVPLGAAGELTLGGSGLARGYLGRPDLTAERFVPDPFGRSGERLYRTGDRARWLPDGNLQFLGRIDQQVKIRGVRLETGEIESALAACPGVRAAAVVATGAVASRTLTAFLVLEPDTAPSPPALRAHLRERLPEAMVPAAFVALDALPLTPNGKVDRRALAQLAPAAAVHASSPADTLPGERTPFEDVLAAIWCEVLGVDRVGPEDDFFDLGGHSLLATQVISRVRTSLGVELPVRALFETPRLAALARAVETALRSREGSRPPLRPAPRDGGPLPLSFAQERLWFIEQLQPGTPTYNVVIAAVLDGRLDAGALARGLATIVERHEALRTRFPISGGADGSPVQVIDPPPAWVLPQVDLSGLPAGSREAAAQALLDGESRRPFDLAAGPLLRAVLLRLSPEEHVALIAAHHIVVDGWSMQVLTRELTALYAAEVVGEPSPLAPLPIQYADFAHWQRQWLSGEALASQLAFWRERLAGAPAVLDLPLDRPRPALQSFRGARQELTLDSAVAAALRGLARRTGSTLFMTLLAAFDVLLQRWSGATDLVVGTPSANRDREEIEGLIGFFVNTLALRADLAGDPAFPELLGRVREATLAAYTHQDLPFEKIVAELKPERDLAYTPVFQVMFLLQAMNAGTLGDVELPGLTMRFPEVETETTKFDLIVSFDESPAGLGGEWRYNVDLFDGTTMRRMTRHFAVLLAGIAADPERPLPELPWITEAERHQTVTEWNGEWNDPSSASTEACFPDLFRERMEAWPDAVAVAWQDVHLSYADLDRRSEAAASLLVERGVSPDSVVGLLARRGSELPVAILAIQKAGGAWMPLEPAQPRARLEKMIEGSGAGLLLTGEGIEPPAVVPALPLADLLAAPPAGGRLPSRLQSGNIAYLLYTSGSTGTPKGVMVTHRGLREHMLSKAAYLGLTAGDVVAQTAAPTFDISVWQLLSVLLAGGRVQMLATDEAREPARLLAAAEREGITVLQLVPSLLRAVCEVAEESPDRPGLAALRWLIPTGEALPPDLGRRWLALYPGIPMVDAYGPTECTDEVSHQILREALRPERTVTPIGRPSRGIRLHVVDRQLRPVPIGVTGELCVAGVAVGRGYRYDPARTAEAFVPDPFGREAGEPGSRLYRTGDLARLLPDGALEYLGRRDRQVKIRGFRIETGEVEAALRAHPEVREAAVLARPVPGSTDLRLVAYVVPGGGGDAWTSGLRTFLADRLPDSMIPAAFVALDSLPLSANGKLDVRALPEPEQVTERAAAEPPGTPLEREIAALWQEVLGTDRFGVRDNFFELGGDSIKGAILMHRLQRRLNVVLSVVT
ncbi:MAG TPA: amino acid adenylation domain-containing protein, partial [Thermoanaerobaculia bacterium]|nr:amino acid adenylation domain-containing protein [Thermoanaerobaculia bacterium]